MNVNIWAVIAAGIASMVVGSIWYGPLFGKIFTKAMVMDQWSAEKKAEMKKSMALSYVWQFVASLVMFYVLAWFLGATNMWGAKGGMIVAFWGWLGFVLPLKFGDALWGGKMTLFWIGASNSLVTLLVGGAIIGHWI